MRTTPWTKIKAEYLQGVTPKELAQKYKIASKTIREKASKENWVSEKATIYNNLQQKTEDKIERITNLALKRLEDVLTNDLVRTNDLVSAIGKALDISGLKSSKQEIKTNQPAVKVEVSEKKMEEVLKRVNGLINE